MLSDLWQRLANLTETSEDIETIDISGKSSNDVHTESHIFCRYWSSAVDYVFVVPAFRFTVPSHVNSVLFPPHQDQSLMHITAHTTLTQHRPDHAV